MPETLGIFGGTFDPPHLGHLILAAEALAQLQLERLLWVLTPQPPHKPDRPITALSHRLEMLRLAITAAPGFELSTVEIDRSGPHYTVETLALLRTQFPGADFALLIGGDSLRNLPRWYQPQDIVMASRYIGVMRRPHDSIEMGNLERLLPGLGEKVRFIETPRLEISSSDIRQRIASGGHFRYYLPPSVYDYIQQNNLYR